ncbi:MAG: hypothetical protein ACUVTQ_00970 [Desulfotomaculales bacterium]
MLESDYALALEMLADLRQELELLCQDGKNRPRELAGFATAVAEAAAQLACLKQELREPFMLFVMGMGKYGKSTLVNVLLGGRYADVDSLPKTWKIDVFTAHGLNGSATLRFRNGQIETHPTEKVRKILAE